MILLEAAAIVAAVWLVSLWVWPYGPCRRCQGRRGRGPGSNTKRWRRCKRCKGSGERVRWGARLFRKDL